MQPMHLAIVKCQAHRKSDDFVAEGNNATDKAAKEVANSKSTTMAP